MTDDKLLERVERSLMCGGIPLAPYQWATLRADDLQAIAEILRSLANKETEK